MTAEQKRTYVLADNKLALNAGWDEAILALELQALLQIDPNFDVGVTGFSIAEFDGLIEGLSPEEPGNPDDDRLPDLQGSNCASRLGDLWELGPHRLLCGNALEKGSLNVCLGVSALRWRSPIPRTMFPLPAMLAAQVGSSTASSSWLRARCHPSSL